MLALRLPLGPAAPQAWPLEGPWGPGEPPFLQPATAAAAGVTWLRGEGTAVARVPPGGTLSISPLFLLSENVAGCCRPPCAFRTVLPISNEPVTKQKRVLIT